MSHFVAIILGFVEGATEFIPVSSSGHLIIARQILGANNSTGLAFDAIIQLATSCALLVYFWKDVVGLIKNFFIWISGKPIEHKEKTLLLALIIGTIPAVVFGLLLQKEMDTVFRSARLVAVTLILGSILMWYAQKYAKKYDGKNNILSVGRGVVIGLFQCLALVPGISRSGATISGGLFSGLDQKDSVRFSFLLSMPVLFGGGIVQLFEIRHQIFSAGFGSSLLIGSIVAFVVGLISIKFLMKYLKTHDLDIFIWYRIAVAILVLIFL